MSWRQGQTAILTQSSSDHSSTSFSSWLGLLNRGSLRAQKPSVCRWLSLWHIVSNWLEPPRAPGYIIVSRTPASAVLPLIYIEVHILIDGSVEGQYVTISIGFKIESLEFMLFLSDVKHFENLSYSFVILLF